MSIEQALRALASERRLRILEWLKDPVANFRPQVDGDLVRDGVCGLFRPKRIKQWTFYKRDEARIRQLKQAIAKGV
jgi:hypothetical protein